MKFTVDFFKTTRRRALVVEVARLPKDANFEIEALGLL
jgi:hypothetical protein